MTLTEMLPNLSELKRADKIRAVQFLVNQIAREEDLYFEPNGNYPIWSPHNSDDAATKLRELLESEAKNG